MHAPVEHPFGESTTVAKIPEFYQQGKKKYPDVFDAYESMSEAAKAAGPLDAKTVALAKLAMSIGAGLEGATHSAGRKGRDAGCSDEEMRHVALLGVTTLGFPTMMRARAWVEDVL